MRIAKRRIMVWLAVAAVYFAAGEAFRAYARAGLEREMRADFEKLLCPADRIDGDICLDFPDEGRCVSGEYVDYRTVWGRVWFDAGATRVIAHHHERLGRDKRKLANWLACQGFRSVVYDPARSQFLSGGRQSGPRLDPSHRCDIGHFVFWKAGYGAVATNLTPFPFRVFGQGISGGMCTNANEDDQVEARITARGFWAK